MTSKNSFNNGGRGQYIKKRLFSSGKNILWLLIAPVLWGLLALNNVIKADAAVLPGVPLVQTSLTIVVYRFFGAVALSLIMALCISYKCKKKYNARPFRYGLLRYFSANRSVVSLAVLFGCVFALPAFFLAFDYLNVTMTNVLAVGLVPLLIFLIKFVVSKIKKCSGWATHHGLNLKPSDKNIYSVMSLCVQVLLIVAFLSLTFDTWNILNWDKIARKQKTDHCVEVVVEQLNLDPVLSETQLKLWAGYIFKECGLANGVPDDVEYVTEALRKTGAKGVDLSKCVHGLVLSKCSLEKGDESKTGNASLIGGACCLIYGLCWGIYLLVTGSWASGADCLERGGARKSFNGCCFAACCFEEEADYDRYRKESKGPLVNLDLCGVLLVKVGAVQLIALVILIIFAGTAAGLGLETGVGGLFADVWVDIEGMKRLVLDNIASGGWWRLLSFIVVIVLPSFGAYVALNSRTSLYDEANKSPVKSETWNGMFAFAEPLVATVLGIYLLGLIHPALSEHALFAFPTGLIMTVFILFFAIGVLNFAAIFRTSFSQDLSRYLQKLEKIYDDVLKHIPSESIVHSCSDEQLKEWVDKRSGFKESDCDIFKRMKNIMCLSLSGEQLKSAQCEWSNQLAEFFDFERNLREQAQITLFQKEWNCGFSNIEPQVKKLRDSSIPSQLLSANFGDIWGGDGKNWDVFSVILPGYGECVPWDTFEWREIEKGMYLYLTGSIWFKLSRHKYWRPAISALYDDVELFKREFLGLTKGWFVLPDNLDWHSYRKVLNNETQSWRQLLSQLSINVLDLQHMTKGDLLAARNDLGVNKYDKALYVLVPKNGTAVCSVCEGLIYGGLLSVNDGKIQSCVPDIDGIVLVKDFANKLVQFYKSSASWDSRFQFDKEVYSRPFVLYGEEATMV